jgi:hypothetical protein
VAILGLAPAVFAAYTYAQLAVGNEWSQRPGNVERFFPLLVAVFVLAAAVAIGAWSVSVREPLPPATSHENGVVGGALLGIAAFVAIALHLPTYLDALSSLPTNVGYLETPTAFWLVKFMDLGIVTPAAVAVGIGTLGRRPWARRPLFALVGGYALLGVSVAAMAVTMTLTDDPDASVGTVVGSLAAAAAVLAVAGFLYRALFRRGGVKPQARDGRTR